MGVGLRLKTILRNQNMTIKELSEKSGIPLNTLYSITKRDSTRVDPVIIQQVANTLQVPCENLTGEARNLKKMLSNGSARTFIVKQIIKASETAGISFADLCCKVGFDIRESSLRRPNLLISNISNIEEILSLPYGTFENKLVNEFTPRMPARDMLLDVYDSLNQFGQEVALQRIQELAEIPRYQNLDISISTTQIDD